MNKEELAAKLNGSKYPLTISNYLHSEASENGFVIVYGESDDLMEFLGAIDYEIGVCSGNRVLVSKNGVVPSWESISENDPKEDYCRKYFLNKNKSKPIKAILGVGEYSWTYETEIPHSCFDIMYDGEKYCRGIVFHVDDIYRPVMNEHQKLIIGVLKNKRDLHAEGLDYCVRHANRHDEDRIIPGTKERIRELEREVEEIDAAIAWVKRQAGE